MSRQALILQELTVADFARESGLFGFGVIVLGVRLFLPIGGKSQVTKVAVVFELFGVSGLVGLQVAGQYKLLLTDRALVIPLIVVDSQVLSHVGAVSGRVKTARDITSN